MTIKTSFFLKVNKSDENCEIKTEAGGEENNNYDNRLLIMNRMREREKLKHDSKN